MAANANLRERTQPLFGRIPLGGLRTQLMRALTALTLEDGPDLQAADLGLDAGNNFLAAEPEEQPTESALYRLLLTEYLIMARDQEPQADFDVRFQGDMAHDMVRGPPVVNRWEEAERAAAEVAQAIADHVNGVEWDEAHDADPLDANPMFQEGGGLHHWRGQQDPNFYMGRAVEEEAMREDDPLGPGPTAPRMK